jgi:hypothetical protein
VDVNNVVDVAQQAAQEQEKPVASLDEARLAATAALRKLGEEIARNLRERLAAVENPARAEIGALQAKAAALRESYAALQPRVASKRRLLATAVDEAIASARDDEAAQKRAEATELQTNLENIESEAARCDARAAALTRQLSIDIEAVFKESYGDARRSTVEASTALAALLDQSWDSLREYDRANANSLTGGLGGIWRRINLTPDDRGVEKAAFYSLVRWFGFGGRTR